MTTVLVSGRVLTHNVGGNTRYARAIYSRLADFGVDHVMGDLAIRSGGLRSVAYAAVESVVWPLARNRHINVIHYPADTGAVITSRTPIVGTIHGLATMHVRGVRSPVADAIWKARVRALATVSTTIITVSESSADDIARFVPGHAAKIVPIPHGIDHDRFNTIPTKVDVSVVGSREIPRSYFLYLGNLDPRKNLLELARAASRVFRKTGVPLVVAGAPAWDSDEIVRVVTQTDGVIYVGRVDENQIVPLMQGATAFCFPSSYEGFGFPVLEAMACGTPVLCSDRGALAEIAGEAALVISDISSQSIADGMIEILSDGTLRNELSKRGLYNAKQFQWSKSASAHAEVFRDVAG